MDPWAALGDPTRRRVLASVASGPRSVTAIAEGLPVSRPAVSQHLKVLKCAGLVRARQLGTRRIYHLDPAGIEVLRAELDQFWADALSTFQRLVDETEGDDG